MAYRFAIIGGPDKDGLKMAVFTLQEDGSPRPTEFIINDPGNEHFPENGASIDLIIRQAGRETSDGLNFGFEGHYPGNVVNTPAIGRINVETRTGWVEF